MLQFSRRSEAVKESVDINLLIEKALDLCSKDYDFIDKYDFKKIQIERNYSDDIPAVACIKTEVEQVLLNILKNASHAIKEISDDSHMPCISISTEAENNMCIIRISDNGIGIPASVLTHIFEPFFYDKTDRRRDRPGSFSIILHYYQPSRRLHQGRLRRGPRYDLYDFPALVVYFS